VLTGGQHRPRPPARCVLYEFRHDAHHPSNAAKLQAVDAFAALAGLAAAARGRRRGYQAQELGDRGIRVNAWCPARSPPTSAAGSYATTSTSTTSSPAPTRSAGSASPTTSAPPYRPSSPPPRADAARPAPADELHHRRQAPSRRTWLAVCVWTSPSLRTPCRYATRLRGPTRPGTSRPLGPLSRTVGLWHRSYRRKTDGGVRDSAGAGGFRRTVESARVGCSAGPRRQDAVEDEG